MGKGEGEGGVQVLSERVAGWAAECVVVVYLDHHLEEVLDYVLDVLCCDGNRLAGGWFIIGKGRRSVPWTICRSGVIGAMVAVIARLRMLWR